MLTLKRIQSVVRSDYLASRFEGDEGVALLLTCFHERAGEGEAGLGVARCMTGIGGGV